MPCCATVCCASCKSETYDVNDREFKQRKLQRGDHYKFNQDRAAFVHLTSSLYALIIGVIGFVFPITYFISEGKKDNGVYLYVLHIYLYLGALVFLVYTHAAIMYFKRQLRSCDVNLKDNEKIAERSSRYEMKTEPKDNGYDDHDFDGRDTPDPLQDNITSHLVHHEDLQAAQRGLQRHGTLGTMEKLAFEGLQPEDLPIYYAANQANFFLRLSIIVFGLASLVLDAFRLVKFAHTPDPWRCYGWLFLAHIGLRLIFTFILTFFIFKNHKIALNFNHYVMRFGLLHVLITCISMCMLTVVMEISEAYYQMRNVTIENIVPSRTYMFHTNITGELTEVVLVAPYRPYMCERALTMVDTAAPYLYPCVVQFAFLATVALWRMYRNMGGPAALLHPGYSATATECQKATTGLFVGLLLLTGTIISLVFYLVFSESAASSAEDKSMPLLVFFSVECGLTLLALLLTVSALCKARNMKYVFAPNVTVNEVLLLIGLAGLYALVLFMLIPAVTGIANPYVIGGPYVIENIHPLLQGATIVLSIIQATLQLVYLIDSGRRQAVDREVYKAKPGRSTLTCLLIVNMCLWLMRSVEWRSGQLTDVFTEFYGVLAWQIVLHICMPLAIFYRFHSTVCLSQLWTDLYRRTN